ncbi:uncharacterized protein LOC124129904 [Haliotis rufescens]|uniref:uncharacterized protein LOC124129904 n=1 Tax=Haliotis rufescens TaxID=6454 RepID=UPI00201EE965|nr:uncharacterized protein LOC124129904 [Haliotis rufescens]
MKIVVWVVALIFAGTACFVCARCYEDLCNEKRCQICEEIKRHCNTESTSTKCDGFCKDLEVIDYNTQNHDNFMKLWMTGKTRMWKVQSDLAKTRRNLETVSQSLHDTRETIRNLINENNYLRNIISDPKEMLFVDDNAPNQNGHSDCIVQEDSLSRCLTQLEEQSSQTDRFIGYLKEAYTLGLVLLLALACLTIYLLYVFKSSPSPNARCVTTCQFDGPTAMVPTKNTEK